MRVGWLGRQWWAEYKAGVKSLRARRHLGIQIGQGAMRERVLAGRSTCELKGPGQ